MTEMTVRQLGGQLLFAKQVLGIQNHHTAGICLLAHRFLLPVTKLADEYLRNRMHTLSVRLASCKAARLYLSSA